jgi:hypothetical protein
LVQPLKRGIDATWCSRPKWLLLTILPRVALLTLQMVSNRSEQADSTAKQADSTAEQADTVAEQADSAAEQADSNSSSHTLVQTTIRWSNGHAPVSMSACGFHKVGHRVINS